MARVAGTIIPDNKHIEIALTYIFGVGRASAQQILSEVAIDGSTPAAKLSSGQLAALTNSIERRYRTEGELRRQISFNVKRLKDIGTYRGLRHARRLPVRGQRTRTNSRTVRGNVRRTMGSGKRKLEKT
ncbi:30S ribosomal protein S13 [Candidatus Parcubacteria bacterium]|nr:30S ribosomal protein S13 [Candidatus Parcubacteria bacterium]MBI4099266.1 30S ribosomal protein S13 [Candidatus Parcubacteria bacterium]MBI4385737.1 30S ribosomal protein S13 [Candidatus Parcubacteria bacterium]